VIVYSLAIAPVLFIARSLHEQTSEGWRFVAICIFVPLGGFLIVAMIALLAGLLHRLIPRPKPGIYPLSRHGEMFLWTIHAGILNFLRVPGLLRIVNANPALRYIYYGLCGAKIHPSAVISYDAVLFDPYLIELGEGSRIGDFAKCSGHYADADQFVIGKIKIGKQSVVGADSAVGPNTIIEDHAVVGARSLVLPGTHIKNGETWIGNPARKK
jgi:acetyltransferase-like isoleucine patch superfamily enzyme